MSSQRSLPTTWGKVPAGAVVENIDGQRFCVFVHPTKTALVPIEGHAETIVFEEHASTSGYSYSEWKITR